MTVDTACMSDAVIKTLTTQQKAARTYITPNGCRPALAIFPCKEGNKTPLIGKKKGGNGYLDATTDKAQIERWWTDCPYANIGIATGENNGLLVIDVDCGADKHGDESLAELERELGKLPESWISLTPNGGQHLIFKYPKGYDIHSNASQLAPWIDIRANGGYIVAAPSVLGKGRKYEWDAGHSPNDTELAELPAAWLERIVNPSKQKKSSTGYTSEKFELPENIDKGQRNDTLFRYCISLRQKGTPATDILSMMRAANADRCSTPLPQSEIINIYDSAMSYDIKAHTGNKSRFYRDGKFLQNLMGDYLIENCGVCIINDALHIYDDGIYRQGVEAIQGIMLDLIPELSLSKRREVYEYLKVSRHTPRKERSSANLIPFKSKIYNIETEEFLDYSPEYVFLNRFPYDYNPDAPMTEAVFNTLSAIADYDSGVIELLLETFGNCFYMLNSYRGAVFLYGANGHNGKSTLLNMLGQMLGHENVSNLSLQDTAERFRLIGMYGKAANIGDDISSAYFPESATFKKLVTGEYVKGEKKGQDPVDFRNYAKIFFALNELPPIRDKSAAFFSRILLIPLEHDFSKVKDVKLKDRRWTDADMEYLVKLSIDGLKNLIKNGDFIKPAKVVRVLNEYERENNPILMYTEETGSANIIGRTSQDVYGDFCDWCSLNGHRNIPTQINFSRTLAKSLQIQTQVEWRKGKCVRVFCQQEQKATQNPYR